MTTKSFSLNIRPNPNQDFHYEKPLDPQLRYNRTIRANKDKPHTSIFSIDPEKIFRKIKADQFSHISKITLMAREDRGANAVAVMWDVLFNLSSQRSLDACVLFVGGDYNRIPDSRVIYSSSFLDYKMRYSRLHLNKILPGDVMGVGLYDTLSCMSYVLLYGVKSLSSVIQKNEFGENAGIEISAINCELMHVLRVKSDGQADEVYGLDDIELNDNAVPFIEWVVNTANNVEEAYSYKPHLLPIVPSGYNRPVIEENLTRFMAEAVIGRYEDFEELCRKAHDVAKTREKLIQLDERANTADHREKGKRFVPRRPDLPYVDIYSVGDQIIGVFDIQSNGVIDSVIFNKSTLGNLATLEEFLMGGDLIDIDPMEESSIMVIEKTDGGFDYFRQLSINY